ncbi:MAG: transcription termination factor Rho [Luteolibacter sp.]
MSKNITEELFEMPPVKKKTAAKKAAAKKTAAKKVAKKATKKIAAKKTAAKKTSVKPKEPVASTPAPASISAPAPVAAPQPLAPPAPPAPAPAPPTNEEAPRIGRVPGGGPVNQPSENRQQQQGNNSQPQRESRSKKRRDKRKRRRDNFGDDNQDNNRQENSNRRNNNGRNNRDQRQPQEDRSPAVLSGPLVDTDGILELTAKGYGFLRLSENNFEALKEDIFVSPELIRNHALRHGQWLHGQYQSSTRGPQLIEIKTVNGLESEEAAKLPHFDELKAINPDKRIAFETTPERYTTRVLDIISPVGRGQRGLIVSPPRSGKTTLLLHMAEAIQEKYDEQIHLMILLVDERPEEVTEFRRALPEAEIYASSNDEAARNHTRIAEFAIERAKRLVEAGQHVFLLMDSITRLARAYNGAMSSGKGGRGRGTGSGGITIGALEVPRRLFAAARNTREAGSLTILATALIETNSRADEAIYMEFKGTGNMELVLDRKIAESYIYPAADIFKSGTRREELLLPEHTLYKIHLIRRGLAGHRPFEAMERLLYFIKKFPNNPQMLMEIKG